MNVLLYLASMKCPNPKCIPNGIILYQSQLDISWVKNFILSWENILRQEKCYLKGKSIIILRYKYMNFYLFISKNRFCWVGSRNRLNNRQELGLQREFGILICKDSCGDVGSPDDSWRHRMWISGCWKWRGGQAEGNKYFELIFFGRINMQ